MPAWRDDKILELANQLTYSPADKRREQLVAAIGLLGGFEGGGGGAGGVDAAKSYPWDFVHFRITGFQPRTHVDHVVAGKVLRADLASLIEFLSDTLSIRVEDAGAWGADLGGAAGDRVLEFDDVSRKFSVSSKTIQRWRKQGLIALRFLYADGRRRLGFLESAVTRFAAANKDKVDRSAHFTQLSDEERAKILVLAREIVAGGAHGIAAGAGAGSGKFCIKDVSRLIAKHLGRSPETIRYTIRRYDAEHPEAAIFGTDDTAETRRSARSAPEKLSPPDPDPYAQDFVTVEMIDEHTGKSMDPPVTPATNAADVEAEHAAAATALRARAHELKLREITFMPNPLFEHPDAASIILRVLPVEALTRAQATVSAGTNVKGADVYMARMPRDLPAFLADIFRQPVMPQEIEIDAFRRMNYLKCQAARLQSRLDPAAATAAQLAEIESLLAQADAVKNTILQGNLRVAVHVARKHQRADRPLIELVSDATIWVMRAIEKFDFTRHTRFSTYASYAIMKNFARDRAEQLTRRDNTMLTGQEEVLDAVGDRAAEALEEQVDAALLTSDLRQEIQNLPAREKELLTSHYGLEQGRPALSLSEIGDKMGITKARVRQLEARALRQLRQLMESRREKIRQASAKRK